MKIRVNQNVKIYDNRVPSAVNILNRKIRVNQNVKYYNNKVPSAVARY